MGRVERASDRLFAVGGLKGKSTFSAASIRGVGFMMRSSRRSI
jgi:hypothetical protein